MNKKIINGYTKEGEPIWRWQTAEDKLIEELSKVEKGRKLKQHLDPTGKDVE
jgi:hypothetical protein